MYHSFRSALEQSSQPTANQSTQDEQMAKLLLESDRLNNKLMTSASDLSAFNSLDSEVVVLYEEFKQMKVLRADQGPVSEGSAALHH